MSDYFWTRPRYPSLKAHSDFNHSPRVCTNLPTRVDFEERYVSSYLNLFKFCLYVCLSFSIFIQLSKIKLVKLFIFLFFKQSFHSFLNRVPSLDLWERGIDGNVVNFNNIGGYVFLYMGKILVHYFRTGKFTGDLMG